MKLYEYINPNPSFVVVHGAMGVILMSHKSVINKLWKRNFTHISFREIEFHLCYNSFILTVLFVISSFKLCSSFDRIL